MAGIELLVTAQPHLLPGYTGYLPQYRYRCGGTYGRLSHKLLVDPTVKHASLLVAEIAPVDDSQLLIRPAKCDIDIVNGRDTKRGAIHRHPVIPGYEGFIPRITWIPGQRYSVAATEALAEFERKQVRDKVLLNRMKEEGKSENCAEIQIKNLSLSPRQPSERCDEKVVRQKQKAMNWLPAFKPRPEPPASIQPTGIYQKHVGLMPNYLGHVPGEISRYGTTFGAGTKDAKKWLLKS